MNSCHKDLSKDCFAKSLVVMYLPVYTYSYMPCVYFNVYVSTYMNYYVYYTLYRVHCTLYIVHCTLYTVHCTLYIIAYVFKYVEYKH